MALNTINLYHLPMFCLFDIKENSEDIRPYIFGIINGNKAHDVFSMTHDSHDYHESSKDIFIWFSLAEFVRETK